MPAVQGQTYKMLFMLSAVGNPSDPFTTGVPFAAGEVQITKPDGAPTDAANIATITHRGDGIYQLGLSVGETGLGLLPGETGELIVRVNKTGAVLRQGSLVEVVSHGPGTLTLSTATDVVDAVAAALVDDFAALPTAAEVATAVSAPTAAQVRDAVWAQLSDGSPVLQRLTAAIALLLNKAQLPGEDGGPIVVRDVADSKDRVSMAITSGGARTVTTPPDGT